MYGRSQLADSGYNFLLELINDIKDKTTYWNEMSFDEVKHSLLGIICCHFGNCLFKGE